MPDPWAPVAAKWLPLGDKDHISAFLLTEPGVGSDPARMASIATPVDATVVYYGQVDRPANQLVRLKGPVLGHFADRAIFSVKGVTADGLLTGAGLLVNNYRDVEADATGTHHGDTLLVFSPEHARTIAGDGWSKADMREFRIGEHDGGNRARVAAEAARINRGAGNDRGLDRAVAGDDEARAQ